MVIFFTLEHLLSAGFCDGCYNSLLCLTNTAELRDRLLFCSATVPEVRQIMIF